MRSWAWFPVVLCLAACSSRPEDSSKLTLRNTQWDHVNVELVITRAGSCSDTGSDVVSSQNFVMHKDETKPFIAPAGTSICWRHDRFPNKPKPGEWTDWSHATLFPNSDDTTDL